MKKQILVATVLIAATAMAIEATPFPSPLQQAASSAPARPAPQTAPAQAAPTGNAANGRKLFVSFGCYQCHGYEAQGSSATGPRLAPRPIAFDAFVKYVRHPTNQMPPFTTKVVTDAELTDVYAFLRSVPPPPDADSIPLLK